MAWNPSPEVAAARDFGKQFDADRVVIYYATPNRWPPRMTKRPRPRT